MSAATPAKRRREKGVRFLSHDASAVVTVPDGGSDAVRVAADAAAGGEEDNSPASQSLELGVAAASVLPQARGGGGSGSTAEDGETNAGEVAETLSLVPEGSAHGFSGAENESRRGDAARALPRAGVHGEALDDDTPMDRGAVGWRDADSSSDGSSVDHEAALRWTSGASPTAAGRGSDEGVQSRLQSFCVRRPTSRKKSRRRQVAGYQRRQFPPAGGGERVAKDGEASASLLAAAAQRGSLLSSSISLSAVTAQQQGSPVSPPRLELAAHGGADGPREHPSPLTGSVKAVAAATAAGEAGLRSRGSHVLPITALFLDTVAKAPLGEAGGAPGGDAPGGGGGGSGGQHGDSASAAMSFSHLNLQQQRWQQESDSTRKHLQSVEQAKESQKEMKRFEKELKRLEEQAGVVRRRARYTARADKRPALAMDGGGGDSAEAAAGGAAPASNSRPSSGTDEDESRDSDDDDDDERGGDREDQTDADTGELSGARGLSEGPWGSPTTEGKSFSASKSARYTPSTRHGWDASGRGTAPSGSTANAAGASAGAPSAARWKQQEVLLQRYLASAERFLRENPDCVSTLRDEVMDSEQRLSVARTSRQSGGDATRASARGLDERSQNDASWLAEHIDWRGPERVRSADGHHNTDDAASPLLLSRTVGADDEEMQLPQLPSGEQGTGALELADGSSRPRLSDSLRGLDTDELLAELLERGNGKWMQVLPQQQQQQHVARLGLASARRRSADIEHTHSARQSPFVESPGGEGEVPAVVLQGGFQVDEAAHTTTGSEGAVLLQQAHPPATSTPPGASVTATKGAESLRERQSKPQVRLLTGSTRPSGEPAEDRRALSGGKAASRSTGVNSPRARNRPAKVARRVHEPLPVLPGVGALSAARLRQLTGAARLQELELRIASSQSTRRACELLRTFQHLRTDMIDKDIVAAYRASDPGTWDEKYRRGRSKAAPATTTDTRLPRIAAAQAPANRDGLPRELRTASSAEQATLTASSVLSSSLANAEEGATGETTHDDEFTSVPGLPTDGASATDDAVDTAATTLSEPTTPNIPVAATATTMTTKTATTAVSPAGALVVSTRDGPPSPVKMRAGHPACASAAQVLEQHRRTLFRRAGQLAEEQRQQARMCYIDVLEDVGRREISESTWPAAAAALAQARTFLTQQQQQQSEQQQQQQGFAGFRAIVHGHFSLLQLTQWPVQRLLERLAALFRMSSGEYREWLANLYQKLSNSHDYEACFRAIDRTVTGLELPDEARVRLVLHCCRRLPRFFAMPQAPSPPPPSSLAVSAAPSRSPAPSPHAVPLLPADMDGSLRGMDSASTRKPAHEARPSIQRGTGGQATDGLLADGRSAAVHAAPAAESAALTPPLTDAEYSVRIDAERQSITSSAVPAVSASQATGASAHASFRGQAGGRFRGRGPTRETPTGADGGRAPTVSSGKTVQFRDQTFKLHLYDARSPIRLTLLRDGQPVAEGSFSVQRYGNGRRTQLWLPLTLTQPEGPLALGDRRRRTELKLTIEVG